jgi:hypothetical protein
MNYTIRTDGFSQFLSVKEAEKILKSRNVDDIYGDLMTGGSVSRLVDVPLENPIAPLSEIGVIDKNDLGLGDTFTMEDVIEKSLQMGYSKISVPYIINYINHLRTTNFDRGTAIVSLMDDVSDGDGIPGVVYLQPDENGCLCNLGFFEIDKKKRLSPIARFLVGKS